MLFIIHNVTFISYAFVIEVLQQFFFIFFTLI